MKRALILGCGYTGERLAHQLQRAGVNVVGTNRSGVSGTSIPIRRLDALDVQELDLPEADEAVVYYSIGTLFKSYDGRERSHLRPLLRILDALGRRHITGLIYLSATSVYGDRRGEWVDERSELAPDSPWGQMRVDLEQAVWQFGDERGVPAAVLRLPEIYGPDRSPLDRVREGYRLRCPDRFSNRIYVDDLVDVMAELGRRRDRRLLLVADGTPATTTEVYEYAAQLLGLPSPQRGGALPTDPNILSLVRDSKRCRNDELLAWLGRPLAYPSYREGFAKLLTL